MIFGGRYMGWEGSFLITKYGKSIPKIFAFRPE